MKPKLIMTLLVRDEEDILERNICFHLNHGVDFIVATDNGSVDNTPKILEKYKRLGVLDYTTVTDFTYQQSKWVSAMAKKAVTEHGATHLIHCDADEFWLPNSGNLKDHLPSGNKVFFVPIVNYLPEKHFFAHFFQQRTVVKSPYPRVADHKVDSSDRYLLFVLSHKIIITSEFTNVMQGNHLVFSQKKIKRVYLDTIFIHHFSIRSYKHFERKVKNGGSAYEKNPVQNPAMGWQWKDWYKYYKAGVLRSLYNCLCISPDKRKLLMSDGMLVNMFVPREIMFAVPQYYLRRYLANSQK